MTTVTTLVGTPDPDEQPAQGEGKFWEALRELDETLGEAIDTPERVESEPVQPIAPPVKRHDDGIPNAQVAHFVQTFEGPISHLDAGLEIIAAKLEANAWGWAETGAAEAGYENVAKLQLIAVGRKQIGKGWVNAATWTYARW